MTIDRPGDRNLRSSRGNEAQEENAQGQEMTTSGSDNWITLVDPGYVKQTEGLKLDTKLKGGVAATISTQICIQSEVIWRHMRPRVTSSVSGNLVKNGALREHIGACGTEIPPVLIFPRQELLYTTAYRGQAHMSNTLQMPTLLSTNVCPRHKLHT